MTARRSKAVGTSRPWPLSPSDFAFLWSECRCCFYEKLVLKKSRPRSPFPKVFGVIDGAMKDFYLGERAENLALGLSPGVIGGGDRWVKSRLLVPPGCSTACFIRGRVDVLLECDDGTLGVLDFKTSQPKDDHVTLYGRQLHAYALALEQPASGQPLDVSTLGLLCFVPSWYEAEGGGALVGGEVDWIEVCRDASAFLEFLGEVVRLLEQPTPPPPSPDCPWCGWKGQTRQAS
jgi:hypothetical protein